MTLYVKFFPKDHIIKSIKYTMGLNVYNKKLNYDPEYQGGLHYTDFENMHKFTKYGTQIGFITIPNGVPIIKIDDGKYKSSQINIEEFMDFDKWLKNFNKHIKEKKRIKDPVLHVLSNYDSYKKVEHEIIKRCKPNLIDSLLLTNSQTDIGFKKDSIEAVQTNEMGQDLEVFESIGSFFDSL